MILYPSKALSYIDNYKAELNHRFSQLRYVAETIIEMGYTEEDYGEYCKPLKITKSWQILDDLASSLADFPERMDKCVELIKILKALKGHKKPNEETLKATSKELMILFGHTAQRTPSVTLESIDESQKNIIKKLDDLKNICQVFNDYGVTDKDYVKEYAKDTHSQNSFNLVYLLKTNSKQLEEATGLVEAIKASDFKPYKSWWDKTFRKKPVDETLQAFLNRLLALYVEITITW